MNPREVLEFAKKNKVQIVDLKFVDLLGTWQHFSIPVEELNEGVFKDGSGLDGSSIRGWKAINDSDLLMVPDPATACLDPFCAVPTMSLIGNIFDPITREPYDRDPRFVAQKAEKYLQSTKIGDISYWGPEAEFFIFDHARYDQTGHSGYYFIDSEEGAWNIGQEGHNLGGKIRNKEGYFPVPPADTQQDIRSEMILEMQKVGISIEKHHHETATAGQAGNDIPFDSLVKTADKLMMYKYVVKNVARRHGKTATFMPKPIFGDNGSGMHCHQSIWKDEKNLFAGDGYAGLSETALYYIGGILKHAPAICAFSNPGTNSYKRLVPGFEAPINLAYSSRNRSAACRIPYVSNPKGRRVEVRFPDPTANPYLAFSAMLMAGLDGIQNKVHPGDPMDKNLYDLPPEELKDVPTVCGSLREAIGALDNDREFLTRGGVFTDDMLDAYIALKMEEVTRFRMTTHPIEFDMYFSL